MIHTCRRLCHSTHMLLFAFFLLRYEYFFQVVTHKRLRVCQGRKNLLSSLLDLLLARGLHLVLAVLPSSPTLTNDFVRIVNGRGEKGNKFACKLEESLHSSASTLRTFDLIFLQYVRLCSLYLSDCHFGLRKKGSLSRLEDRMRTIDWQLLDI